MTNLVSVLCERDGLTLEQAISRVTELKEELNELLEANDLDGAYYILDQENLEPDYLMDLI